MSATTSAPLDFGFVFLSEFAEQGYQRPANRGSRNLRCFPHCRAKGHVKSGFCGAPLAFQLNSLPAAANGNVERVLTWGEFTSVLAPPRFKPGDIISENSLEREERSADNPLNALFRGDLDEWNESDGSSCTAQSPRFQFNLQMAPYHCDWAPQTPPIEGDYPCFIAHVFLQGMDNNGQVTLQCLFSCRSKSFNILGRVSKVKAKKSKTKKAAAATATSATPAAAITATQVSPATPTASAAPVAVAIESSSSKKSGSNSRKRSSTAALPDNVEAAMHGSVEIETPAAQVQAKNMWLQQPASSFLPSKHVQPLKYETGNGEAWTEIQTTPPQQQHLDDESSFAGSYMHDGEYSPSPYCMPDSPSPLTPFTDWDTSDDTTGIMECSQQINANENKERVSANRVSVEDARTSNDETVISKRRRGIAVATSALNWIQTVGARMHSIAAGTVAVIQNDPLVDVETIESAMLYPNLIHFIIQHSAQEAYTKHQAEQERKRVSIGHKVQDGGSGGGVGAGEGMDGIAGLFAEGELAAMFSSDIAMFGTDVAMFDSHAASAVMDDTLWDMVDEGIDDSRAVLETETKQTVDTDYHDAKDALKNNFNVAKTKTIGENDVNIPTGTAIAAHGDPPMKCLSLAALHDHKTFQALSSFMNVGLTEVINQAISNIETEFEIPVIVAAVRAMFTYNPETWTAEREELIYTLFSSLGRYVTRAVNIEMRARGVSHKDVVDLGSQLKMHFNTNTPELIPFMGTLARRLIGEYVEDPMPDPPVPVPSHLDLTGKWERIASIEAGFSNEQLELTAAMNAISLGSDNKAQHHSPHLSTNVTQQYTIVHQQHAFKIRGKRWMLSVLEAVVLLDGVARTTIEDGGLDENVKFALAPRLRGWHTPDGSVIVVMSMPIKPEAEVDDEEPVGAPHLVKRHMRTGLNTMSITTMLLRHHDTPSFADEITRVYMMQPNGMVDTLALSALPGCALLTSVTEEYSRVKE